jgi:hypothetical protein
VAFLLRAMLAATPFDAIWKRLTLATCLSALAFAVVGCAAGSGNGTSGLGGSGGSGGKGASSGPGPGPGSGGSSASGLVGSGGSTTGSSATGGGGPGVIYAHTNTTLFELDPMTLAATQIGDFDCIGGSGQDSSMTDVAVNSAGEVWAISETKVYALQIQGSTVHCAQTIPLAGASGATFYALTFAPAGSLDPSKEVLVAGNTAGELWGVDASGQLTQHGSFGTVPSNDGNGHSYQNAGKVWELSGDIVFLANSGSPVGFATVRDCPNPPSTSNCDTSDTLIQIDMSKLGPGSQSVTQSVRGKVVQGSGCPMNDTHADDFAKLYGIGAWNDKVYGFSHGGALVEIDNTDGTACLVQYFSQNAWSGAGVTTLAPVKPPPPK